MASRQGGDTLVEVLMAIVIISTIIVGAMTIMTRGLAAAQLALEHSQVRQEVNGQIEMLRYARDMYVSNAGDPSAVTWTNIVSATNDQPVNYNSGCAVTTGKQGFYVTKNATQVTRTNYSPSTPPITATPGSGMWVESVRSASGITPAYMDYVVRACWQASGSGGQQRTVTAVRLYDPSR